MGALNVTTPARACEVASHTVGLHDFEHFLRDEYGGLFVGAHGRGDDDVCVLEGVFDGL